MNAGFDFALAHLAPLLRLAAVLQIAMAGLSLALPRIMEWEADLQRMPLLLRDVFVIHSWFISLTLVIWGVLTRRFAEQMANAPTELSRWLCASISFFWGLRCVLQWLHYDSSLWRGQTGRTVIHWTVFLGYGAWAVVYGAAALKS